MMYPVYKWETFDERWYGWVKWWDWADYSRRDGEDWCYDFVVFDWYGFPKFSYDPAETPPSEIVNSYEYLISADEWGMNKHMAFSAIQEHNPDMMAMD